MGGLVPARMASSRLWVVLSFNLGRQGMRAGRGGIQGVGAHCQRHHHHQQRRPQWRQLTCGMRPRLHHSMPRYWLARALELCGYEGMAHGR